MRVGGCMCTVYEGGGGACVQCMRVGGVHVYSV